MRIHNLANIIHPFLIAALIFASNLTAPSSRAQTPTPGAPSLQIPPGTILPVRFNHTLSSKSAKPGQPIAARLMQGVPLPNNTKIPQGAKVLGTILSVQKASPTANGSISFRFDSLEIHHRTIPIATNLRAIAGFMEVQFAQTPETSPGFGTPYNWVTTRQIGGDEVYGVDGPVTDNFSNHVGKAVNGGVLVHVRAQPGSPCLGSLDAEDRLQALWVFSSDACGIYGIDNLTIVHAGRSSPQGEITLTAKNRDVLVRASSGLLLRIIR